MANYTPLNKMQNFVGQKFFIAIGFSLSLVYGLLFFSSPASAAAAVYPLDNGTQTITIPSYDGTSGLLLCAGVANPPAIDGNNMSALFNSSSYFSYGFYANNPSVGDHTMNCSTGSSCTCTFITGIKITGNFNDTFLSSQGPTSCSYGNPTSCQVNGLETGDFVFSFYLNSSVYENSYQSTTDTTYTGNGFWYGAFQSTNYFTSTGASRLYSYNFSQSPNNTGSIYSYVLNTDIAAPPCTSYVYSDWGACNTETNRKYRTIISSVPTSCNYTNPESVAPILGADCVEFYDAQTVENLYFRFDNFINYCRTDMSCKIPFNFDQNIFGANATGTVFYYASSTATAINLGDINLNTQRSLGIYGVGNLIATSSASSTAFSYYQIKPHSDIYNQDYATSTVAFWFYDSETFSQVFDDVWNASNTPNILGIDTYKLACTPEQWASTSSIPFLGINIELTLCNTKKWVLDVGMQPMIIAQQKVLSLKDSIMTMFPFSLMGSVQNSWKNATDLLTSYLYVKPCYAGDFSTTTGAYTGDFSFEAPNLFGDNTGTTTITLLSKSNLENLLGVEGFFWFNMVCRILIWLAFFGYCWWLVTERLHIEILKH